MTTNIKRFADTTANRQDDLTFEAGRGNGFVAGTIASSAQANKAIFNASAVTEAIAAQCSDLGYSINDYDSLHDRQVAFNNLLNRVARVNCDDVVNTRIPDAVVPGARWQSHIASSGNPMVIPGVVVEAAIFAGIKCIHIHIPTITPLLLLNGPYHYAATETNNYHQRLLPSSLSMRSHPIAIPLYRGGMITQTKVGATLLETNQIQIQIFDSNYDFGVTGLLTYI